MSGETSAVFEEFDRERGTDGKQKEISTDENNSLYVSSSGGAQTKTADTVCSLSFKNLKVSVPPSRLKAFFGRGGEAKPILKDLTGSFRVRNESNQF